GLSARFTTSLEELRGRHFDLVHDGHGNGRRFHIPVGVASHADDGQFSARNLHRRWSIQFAKAKDITERLGFFSADQQVDLNFVLETERLEVIALGMNARPAGGRIGVIGHHRKTERTKEPVLGGLHVAEEIRVMDDAGHVCLVEFHQPNNFEFVGHRGFSIYDFGLSTGFPWLRNHAEARTPAPRRCLLMLEFNLQVVRSSAAGNQGYSPVTIHNLRFASSTASSVSLRAGGREETCSRTRAMVSAIRPALNSRRTLWRPLSPRARSRSGFKSRPSTVSASA